MKHYAIDWINEDGKTVDTMDSYLTYEQAVEWKAAYEQDDENARAQGAPVPVGEYVIREQVDEDEDEDDPTEFRALFKPGQLF